MIDFSLYLNKDISERDITLNFINLLNINLLFRRHKAISRKKFKKKLMSVGYPPRRSERICQIIGNKHGLYSYNWEGYEMALREISDKDW